MLLAPIQLHPRTYTSLPLIDVALTSVTLIFSSKPYIAHAVMSRYLIENNINNKGC